MTIQIQMIGVAEAIEKIRKNGQDIEDGIDAGGFQAGNFIQNELRASINGDRNEPRSVDTGTFGNSIDLDKVEKGVFKIYPGEKSYPNGTTTGQVALILEYGTSHINPRMHFRNTISRNQEQVKNIINDAIKRII